MKATHRRTLLLSLLLAMAAVYFVRQYQSDPRQEADSRPVTVQKNQKKSKLLKLDEDTQAAIQAYFDDVTVLPKENNVAYAIKLDHGHGRKLIARGNEKEAYEIYRKVLAISYKQGSLMGVGIGLGVLSNIMTRMGNNQEAIRLAFLEYKVSKALNNRYEYGVTEQRIGALLQNPLGMAWRLRAMESLKGTPYQQDYVNLLHSLASDLRWFGETERALQMTEQAWRLSNALGNKPSHKEVKSRATRNLAIQLKKAGRCERAIGMIDALLPVFSEAERKTGSYYDLLFDLAACHKQLGNVHQAKQYYATAYSYYEADRSTELGERARARLDRRTRQLTNRLIDSFIDENDLYAALALLETNKSRTLADIRADSTQQAVYQHWTALEQRHADERLALFEQNNRNQQSPNLDSELADMVGAGESDRVWDEYYQLIERQARERQETQIALQIRDVAVSKQISGEHIQRLQKQIGQETAIVSLYMNSDGLSAFVLTDKGLFRWTTDLSYREARQTVKSLQTTLTNPHFDFYREPAQRLEEALVQPLLAHLGPRVKQLIVSPDNLFSGIPLGVLRGGDRYLAQRFAIVRVPSLRYVTFADTGQHPRHGISCVDPEILGARLPFQRDTGNLLHTLYGKQLTELSGADCSPPGIVQAIEHNDTPAFLHIGAHGRFYHDNPMQSGVYLSAKDTNGDGELWNAKAIGAVNLDRFELITFASCEAGVADANFSRDIFGILRTVLFSGAKSVVAPLWAVQDQATSRLMQQFYTAYAQGVAPEQALQQVQTEFIASKQFSHPYYWAGFFTIRGAL